MKGPIATTVLLLLVTVVSRSHAIIVEEESIDEEIECDLQDEMTIPGDIEEMGGLQPARPRRHRRRRRSSTRQRI